MRSNWRYVTSLPAKTFMDSAEFHALKNKQFTDGLVLNVVNAVYTHWQYTEVIKVMGGTVECELGTDIMHLHLA